MDNKVIEIEGMVASGKTSICNEMTRVLKNSIFIDGSAIYRGIAYALSKSKDVLKSNVNSFELMKMLNIDFKIEDKKTVIYINEEEITDDKIQSMENSMSVSKIASEANNSALYEFARNIIDKYRKEFNIIVSARDLTKIYPDMTCHVFVTASLEERVNRRYIQYKGKYTKEEITDIIIKRDELHKNAGYDKVGNKNINLDVTNCKNAHESTVNLINNLIEENYLRREDVIWENM